MLILIIFFYNLFFYKYESNILIRKFTKIVAYTVNITLFHRTVIKMKSNKNYNDLVKLLSPCKIVVKYN